MKRDDLFFDANVARIPAAASIPPVDRDDRRAAIVLRWLTLKLLEAVDGNPRYATEIGVCRLLIAIERRTDADETEPTPAGQVCRGLYLMAHSLYRPALALFERALEGGADEELDPVSRLALEAHAFAMMHIGCERDAREEFERLIDRQLEERPDPAPDAVEPVDELVTMLELLDALD